MLLSSLDVGLQASGYVEAGRMRCGLRQWKIQEVGSQMLEAAAHSVFTLSACRCVFAGTILNTAHGNPC